MASLPAVGTGRTANSSPLQKGLGEADSMDGTQLLSYLITTLQTSQIYQHLAILCPFPIQG